MRGGTALVGQGPQTWDILPRPRRQAEWLKPQEIGLLFTALGEQRFGASKYELAKKLYASTILGGSYSDFLTTLCYDHIMSTTGKARM